MRAQIAILPDGRRHFHDGPIDLILEAWGAGREIAYEVAATRFATILDELCLELPRLRAARGALPEGVVARRMCDAVAGFADERFLTPMAAVAGAVAEEVLAAMVDAAPLERAYVNNGGDIALHLATGNLIDRPLAVPSPLAGEGKGGGPLRLVEALGGAADRVYPPPQPSAARGEGVYTASFDIGLVARPDQPALVGKARLTARDSARGVATSGWRGRSFSLGIADAVTVVARTASLADAAATLIANAVDLPGHPAILRAPASRRDPQSDLGERLVTLDVGRLRASEIATALDNGVEEAEHWLDRGLIEVAVLSLCGEARLVAADPRLYSFERPSREPRYAVG